MPKIILASPLVIGRMKRIDVLKVCCAVAYIPFGLEMELMMRNVDERWE